MRLWWEAVVLFCSGNEFQEQLQKEYQMNCISGVNRDGSLKHNYDPQEFNLVRIGHWNWKWSSTRANYSTYERELLSAILLISGQS